MNAHNPETSVLAAVLVDGGLLPRVAPLVTPEKFASERHRLIFRAMLQLAERGLPVDLVTVTSELEADGLLDRAGGPGYISGLSDGLPDVDNAEGYARLVAEDATRRSLETNLRRAVADAEDGISLPDLVSHVKGGLEAAEAGMPSRLPPPLTLEAALELPEKEIPWLVEGLLPRGGLALLAAPGYGGKTNLAANLAALVAAGREAFGFAVPEAVPVLYWQMEGSPQKLRQRMASIVRANGVPIEGLPLLMQAAEVGVVGFESPDFAAYVEKSGAKLVICDTAQYFFHGDENSATDVARLVTRPLRALGRRLGVTFLVLRHERKPNPNQGEDTAGRHKIRGSSAWFDDFDTVIRLEKIGNWPKDGTPVEARLRFEKVRDAEEPASVVVVYDRGTGLFLRDEAATVRATQDGEADTVPHHSENGFLKVLRERGAMNATAHRKAVGGNATVYTATRNLCEAKGLIRRRQVGREVFIELAADPEKYRSNTVPTPFPEHGTVSGTEDSEHHSPFSPLKGRTVERCLSPVLAPKDEKEGQEPENGIGPVVLVNSDPPARRSGGVTVKAESAR